MRRVEVDRKQLEVHWHGPGAAEAPTLVFLHEGLGSAAQWRDFPARLAEATGCGALVYSRAGYGRSESVAVPRPLTYMHHEGEVVLPALLDALSVQRAVLVGHSDGASIALVHAGTPRANPRVKGLALLAPHVFCEDLSVRSIAEAKVAYERGDLRARLAKYHDDVDAAFWGWNRAWLDPEFRKWNLEAYLPAIRVPVLVIQGEDDPYGTLAQVDAIERGAKDARRLVLPKCGHAPQKDQPERTFEALRDFVRGLSA
jgi:pimeloyl-ACP methyl ester carboxylesterase